ncbi:Asp23/Gls24 family envelope stress response protein [Lacicoccus alkaliphilus]|uniref:Uncharacterized conserved protein YloU, alkaline shock protein (Asp23) family n=1 Tax=Lacicoccus alkaliphilus DSM 16010 TaxID=1123231 RepID=A0A1M7BGH4_9BACL|nr:Asp23/Gls24 family envelope stress response protein [Salinicoccus alkaliphilus]SHL53966.1 Uncharacterized conserved protein YloU, alkaline shock protein (Asp23) family [Salinicoccus alkaliphilus DSM 16010]
MEISTKNSNLGIINISPEVIEVITSIAVTETPGVHSLQNNFASGNIEKLGKKFRGRGVKVDLKDDEVILSIYVALKEGVNVHKVAENIQSNVNQTLRTMLEQQVKEINVHIVNIIK